MFRVSYCSEGVVCCITAARTVGSVSGMGLGQTLKLLDYPGDRRLRNITTGMILGGGNMGNKYTSFGRFYPVLPE